MKYPCCPPQSLAGDVGFDPLGFAKNKRLLLVWQQRSSPVAPRLHSAVQSNASVLQAASANFLTCDAIAATVVIH